MTRSKHTVKSPIALVDLSNKPSTKSSPKTETIKKPVVTSKAKDEKTAAAAPTQPTAVAAKEITTAAQVLDSAAQCDYKPNQRTCMCHYDPHKEEDDNIDDDVLKEHCPITRALQNHITFPSLKLLQKISQKPYGFHWALLVEIVSVNESQFECTGETRFGELVKISFQNRTTPSTFKWHMLRKGHVLAILYAKYLLDLVQVGHLDDCYIFPACLSDVLEQAYLALDIKDVRNKNESPLCYSCDSPIIESYFNKSVVCKNCKIAEYCSKVR
jgi:hypothetical protein